MAMFFPHLLVAAAEARAAAEPHPITYVDFLTVVLTAMAVILAALAIGIGVFAIWGYLGIRDAVAKQVGEAADKALAEKLEKYPAAEDMLELKRRMEESFKITAQITVESNSIADASKTVENGGEDDGAPFPAKDYPPQVGS
jgi:type VI protein secretion system component VasK